MSAKRPPEEINAVKACLTDIHGIEEADHNNLGIDRALKECHGNVQNAAQYYNHNHYSNVPGYYGDDCNGDSIYRPSSSKRRHTTTVRVDDIASTQRASTKSTNNRFTPNKSNKLTTTTTNNKTSSTNNGSSKSQRSGGRRKRGSPSEGDEGKLLHIL